jgi:hypothetical protein
MTSGAAWLLVSLFFAHFLGDFTPLSTRRMQEAKAQGRPVGPIAAHAGVHAVLVALAVGVVSWPGAALLAIVTGVEFTTHLAIDWGRGRIAANRPTLTDPSSQRFWTALGVDQLAHYLVLTWIVLMVV